MNIAFLFNSDDPKYNGYYGPPILKAVLRTKVIQKSGRHMKVSVGDVLTYGKPPDLLPRTYFAHTWSNLIDDRLRATFNVATVYALTFENMTAEIAVKLHEKLEGDGAYLGFLEVDYAYGPHLVLFRNYMILRYRVHGQTCRIFYSMGQDDEKDDYEIKDLKKLGFKDVDWEDKGAHKTIFDDYDTPEHFEQVEGFKHAVAPYLQGREDDASELAMVLEDLNPQLFNSLGSAVVALERARHEEDVAQAAVSGRRYLERLADALFPARDELYNDRKVGKEQYRNRIWAYVADNVADVERVKVIGAEIDRLVEEFNAGLHGDRDKDRMLVALSDTASLTAALLALNPLQARKPYYAFEKRIIDFMKESFARRDNDANP